MNERFTHSEQEYIREQIGCRWRAFTDALFQQMETRGDVRTPTEILESVRAAAFSTKYAEPTNGEPK